MYKHDQYEVTDTDSFETCMAKYSCNYHATEIETHIQNQKEAEDKLFALLEKQGVSFSVLMSDVIPLLVDYGFAREWGGYHTGKYAENQGVIEASELKKEVKA